MTTPSNVQNKVLLFSMKSDDISVTIEASFDQAENLIVEGYDIGKTVKEYWGDSDYEYSVTIPPKEVNKLYTLFEVPVNNKAALLSYLQAYYNTNTCYSEFCDFLSKHKIEYDGFSWT